MNNLVDSTTRHVVAVVVTRPEDERELHYGEKERSEREHGGREWTPLPK